MLPSERKFRYLDGIGRADTWVKKQWMIYGQSGSMISLVIKAQKYFQHAPATSIERLYESVVYEPCPTFHQTDAGVSSRTPDFLI